ncbi:hypothetical protein HF929_11125 [Acidithiobacillus ferrivorans]|nr:hypothetical protein [Acidithiobacillus ferrivorans]
MTNACWPKWEALGREPFRFEAKSLALTRAAYDKIVASECPCEYVRTALVWAERFSKERPEDIWLAEWVGLLTDAMASDEGITAMYVMMIAETEHGIDMRQSSPWAGVLSSCERTNVLIEFVEKWEMAHCEELK